MVTEDDGGYSCFSFSWRSRTCLAPKRVVTLEEKTEMNIQEKKISTTTLVVLCAIALSISVVTATVLVSSNVIHLTVTAPTLNYVLTFKINGTSTDPYVGAIHPGDKLVLTATGNADTVGKIVTFYNNVAYPINSQIMPISCVAEYVWVVPALTSPPNNDVYALRVELS
jgi:hypothetical protein